MAQDLWSLLAALLADDSPIEPALVENDEVYQHWLFHVYMQLAELGEGRSYRVRDAELTWAERAVADQSFRWAPDERALIPLEGGWPQLGAAPRGRGIDDYWLAGVLRYLRGATDRVYELATAELPFARRAVKLALLAWEVRDASVALPTPHTTPPKAGPYR